MAYLYFDESIRENGKFIIGALVVASRNLSPVVRQEWEEMGLDPDNEEYKSSAPKDGNEISSKQRGVIRKLLFYSKLGLVVLPSEDRTKLGNYCADLVCQLFDTGFLKEEDHELYIDENIYMSQENQNRLNDLKIQCFLNSNSSIEAGIQISDHAAHALGGMLLEELGIVKKQVRAGEKSGYPPDELLNLGFELWASLRYALICKQEYIEGLSPPPEDPANPFYRVEGLWPSDC